MSATRIASWLQHKPDNAKRLLLLALDIGNDGTTVQEWPAPSESDASDRARDVDNQAQDYADEQGETVRFALRYVASDGETLVQTILKVRARTKSGYQAQTDGAGVLSQGLRHNEAMARIYVSGMQQSMATVTATNTHLRAENSELRQENAALRAEVRALRELVDEQSADEAQESSELVTQASEAFKTHLLPAIQEGVARAAANAVGNMGGAGANGAAEAS